MFSNLTPERIVLKSLCWKLCISWRDIGDFMENCKMRENKSLGYTNLGPIPSEKVIYPV